MTTVLAFGAFDGVHTGHIHYLRMAKALGDRLIVAISPDQSAWKRVGRYHLDQEERMKLIRELGLADEVVLGSSSDGMERIREHQPDIIAITAFHPIDETLLRLQLEQDGIHSRVVTIETYRPELYSATYAHNSPGDLKR